jgi:hypothetical protein
MSDKLIIFDTTLRDGEQSPGASMTKDEKTKEVLPARSPKPLIVHSTWRAPLRTADREFATAKPKSL